MPSVDYVSNAPPSVFAYPPAMVDKKEEKKEKVETAVLSITAKQKKRDLEKKGEKSDEGTAMETVSFARESRGCTRRSLLSRTLTRRKSLVQLPPPPLTRRRSRRKTVMTRTRHLPARKRMIQAVERSKKRRKPIPKYFIIPREW